MELQITPEPTDEERQAIVAALAQEAQEAEERTVSSHAQAALPRRGDELED